MEEIKSESNYHLAGVIDRIENNIAVIKLDDGQELNWPSDQLPAGLEAGSSLRLKITNDTTDKEDREKLAKTILNEILKGSK